MCYQLPAPRSLFKLALILVFFCFAECAAGSCMSYGHSCWGGHGKRNGGELPKSGGTLSPVDLPNDTKWFISKLMQQNDDSLRFKPKEFLPNYEKKPFRDDAIDDEELRSMIEDGVEPMVPDYSNDALYAEGHKPSRILRGNERLKLLKFLKSIGRVN